LYIYFVIQSTFKNNIMSKLKLGKRNPLFLAGIAANILSFGILLIITNNLELGSQDLFDEGSIFFINYIIALVFFLIVIINNFRIHRWKFYRINISLLGCVVTLFTISCFSLNYAIPVFAELTEWFKAYLILMHLPLFIKPIVGRLPS